MTFVNQTKAGSGWYLRAAVIFFMGLCVGHIATARTQGLQSEIIMTASQSVVGEVIQYPTAKKAQVTAQVITLAPGASTIWHRHPMPTFGYILNGEIEVDYGPRGTRTFKTGDALMEAMAHAHRGRNISDKPVRALVVSIGEKGQPLAQPAEAVTP